jgi:alpha-D-ribose 1-methylphosphonate 5-triphosphate synthase subunit PhnH
MIRETSYDEIYDAQRHFRVILDAMSRPGTVGQLGALALTAPTPLTPGAAAVALALLNADVGFHLDPVHTDAADYLRLNTGSRPAPALSADFVFLPGTASPAVLHEAPLGLPAYPEGGATAVVLVEALGKSSARGDLALTLTGPGIEHQATICLSGLSPEFLAVRQDRNVEFPLGLDFIFVTAAGELVCLPRTTRATWTNL